MSADPIPQLDLDEAWAVLTEDRSSVLIDVRTMAEWNFVGVPDLRGVEKDLRTVEWNSFPSGQHNDDFVAQATDGLDQNQNILLLCRSGARSQAAAEALRSAGYPNVHNVAAGFEGPLESDGHRHHGWKDRLPWVQS